MYHICLLHTYVMAMRMFCLGIIKDIAKTIALDNTLTWEQVRPFFESELNRSPVVFFSEGDLSNPYCHILMHNDLVVFDVIKYKFTVNVRHHMYYQAAIASLYKPVACIFSKHYNGKETDDWFLYLVLRGRNDHYNETFFGESLIFDGSDREMTSMIRVKEIALKKILSRCTDGRSL